MDVFKFHNPTNKTKLEQGEIIEGLTTKMWIERYSTPGEFRFTAPPTSGMKEKLPSGSIISHVNTPEVMIVENHAISEQDGVESEIVITGRSFETILDQRIVGSNISLPRGGLPYDFPIPAAATWSQVIYLINHHINVTSLIDDNNAFPYVVASYSVTDAPGISVDRQIKVESLYNAVLDLLKIENLGIKVIRPGPFWNPWAAFIEDNVYTALMIHKGFDKSSTVSFSYDTGEIINADYLWSNKNYKNAALIVGKWVTTQVVPPQVEYDRRWMIIDGTVIDQGYEAITSDDILTISALMQQKGMEILKSQINLALTKAEVSRENVRALYRKDFDVGDLITVHGDYNETNKMRISEYVEIEDETGERGYPTLILDSEAS